MVAAIILCFLLSWILVEVDRRRLRSGGTDLARLAGTFAASTFLTLIFAIGFAGQALVDAYVSGALDELISDLQTLPGPVISGHVGDIFLLGLIPSVPAVILLHHSRSFLAGIMVAVLGVLTFLSLSFLVRFWGEPYAGSVGLSLLLAIVGSFLTACFAQSLRCEVLKAASGPDRRSQWTLIGKIGGAAMALWLVAAFAFYYLLIFPIPKRVAVKLDKWEHLMVVGSMATPIRVGLFGEGKAYQPAISFQQAVLEETTMRNPLTGGPPDRPGRLQLQFANVANQTFTASSEGMTLTNSSETPAFARSLLTIQTFAGCSARDIASLHSLMASGQAGSRVPLDTSASLEFETYQSLIFHPARVAPDLDIMLPAWNRDWVHYSPLDSGKGASVGSQEPLAGSGRAMLLSSSSIYLVVTVGPDLPSGDRLTVRRGAGTEAVALSPAHVCKGADASAVQAGGFIPWDRITTDRQTRLTGYLVELGPVPTPPTGQTADRYIVRLENAESPTRLKERLTVPLADGKPVDSLLTSMEAEVVGVGMNGGMAVMAGSFGKRTFEGREFGSMTISGPKLQLRDDQSRKGGLRLTGNARRLELDSESHYDTIATQLNDTAVWTMIAAALSGLLAALLFLWRRVPGYEALWAAKPPPLGNKESEENIGQSE